MKLYPEQKDPFLDQLYKLNQVFIEKNGEAKDQLSLAKLRDYILSDSQDNFTCMLKEEILKPIPAQQDRDAEEYSDDGYVDEEHVSIKMILKDGFISNCISNNIYIVEKACKNPLTLSQKERFEAELRDFFNKKESEIIQDHEYHSEDGYKSTGSMSC